MAEAQIQTCQNCKKQFTCGPEDFSLYEKIKVPPPTWCPDCRLMRKMTWRNERSLYKRKCGACGKLVISIYPAEADFPVYCQSCWWGDSWDPMSYGTAYDFSRPFMAQFADLLKRVPSMALFNTTPTNSDYVNYMSGARNCYLLFGGRESEGVLYSNRIYMCKDTVDCYTNTRTELCYQCVQCENSYGLKYCQYCDACTDSAFLFDCRNCQNCFGCANLRGKQYYFLNQPCTKEEYIQKLKQVNLGSYASLQEWQNKFTPIRAAALRKYAQFIKTTNCTGDNLKNAKNCKECFDFSGDDYENCAYSHYIAIGLKDSSDVYGLSRGELLYESLALGFESTENAHYVCSQLIKGSSDIYYCYNCTGSQNLFGCIGLRGKQYCILNKQYSKEEYVALMAKIIEHMNAMPHRDRQGREYRYGEFFPVEMSPFAYNETIAQEYFPLTRDQILEQGYRWKEPETKNYQPTILPKDLPDYISNVGDDILNHIIGCEHGGKCAHQCVTAFKIIPAELALYRKVGLPLPRLCPNCRHYERLTLRNPLKLWHRQCQCSGAASDGATYQNAAAHFHDTNHCPNKFETSYAPNRPEIVYCEQCYNAEIA